MLAVLVVGWAVLTRLLMPALPLRKVFAIGGVSIYHELGVASQRSGIHFRAPTAATS